MEYDDVYQKSSRYFTEWQKIQRESLEFESEGAPIIPLRPELVLDLDPMVFVIPIGDKMLQTDVFTLESAPKRLRYKGKLYRFQQFNQTMAVYKKAG